MAENSGIEWTHHTFNPWIGCTKVSPACDNCYAERWDRRTAGDSRWGAKAKRTRTRPANWAKPIKWDQEAAAQGIRYRVFCASLADVFDNKVPDEWRADLWALIRQTPNLDWLLLTKRPQNIAKMLPDDWADGYHNVWLGTTTENQEEANRRIPHLLAVPAAVKFLSCEPLLGPIKFSEVPGFNRIGLNLSNWWVITGGESGPGYRPADVAWFRGLRDQCAAARVPFLFKQFEGTTQRQIKAMGRALDGVVHDEYPSAAA